MNSTERWLESSVICRWVLGLGAVSLVALRMRYGTSNIPAIAYDVFVVTRNLLDGQGLVFNVGDRFLAITSPLFAFVLAVPGALFGAHRLPLMSVLLNTLFDLGSFWILYRWIGEATSSRWAGTVCAILFALDQRVIEYSSGGNDISLYILLLLCAIRAFQRRSETWLGIFAGLAGVYRPEGLIVMAVLLPLFAWRDRRWPGRATRICGGMLLTYLAALTWYYDSPIPQTLVGLWNLSTLHLGWGRGHIGILYAAQPALALYGRLLWKLWNQFGWSGSAEAAVMMGLFSSQVGLCGWAVWKLSRRDLSLAAAGGFLCVTVAAFCLSDVQMIQGKYEVPLQPLWTAGLVAAWCLLAEKRSPWASLWGPVLIISQLFHIAWAGSPDTQWLLSDHREKGAERAAERACRFIESRGLDPRDTVMSSIVYLPRWYLKARVLDVFGVTYPQALHYAILEEDALKRTRFLNPAIVMDVRPRYLIIYRHPYVDGYGRDPRFRCEYRLVRSEQSQKPFSNYRLPVQFVTPRLEVYERREAGPPHCQETMSKHRKNPGLT